MLTLTRMNDTDKGWNIYTHQDLDSSILCIILGQTNIYVNQYHDCISLCLFAKCFITDCSAVMSERKCQWVIIRNRILLPQNVI